MTDTLGIVIKTILSDDIKDIEKQIKDLSARIKERLELKLKIDASDLKIVETQTEEQIEKIKKKLNVKTEIKIVNTNSKQAFKEIDERVKEIRKNVDELAKVEINTNKEGNVQSAILTYYNKNLGKTIKETMGWSEAQREVNNQLVKTQVFETKKIKYIDDIKKRKDIELEAQEQITNAILETEQKRRKEIIKSDELQAKAINKTLEHNYRLQQEVKRRDFNYGVLIPGVNASDFNSLDSFSSYVQKQYGKSAEVIGSFNDKQLKTGEIITQTTFRVRESNDKWRVYQATLNKTTGEMRVLDNGLKDISGKYISFNEALRIAIIRITQWGLATSLIYGSFHKLKDGLATLKEIDSELINIAKVTEYTTQEMRDLVKSAVAIGQEFGRIPTEYLKAVTEFARAGFEKQAEEYGKLSLLLQNVGDVTAEVANETLIAADAGFQLQGNYEALLSVIDKFNNISNKNATTIEKMSDAMKVGASVFHSAGLSIDETIALIGTATASTQRSGSEISRAWRTILMNIRQVKDEEAEVTEESMAKAEKALNSIGIVVRDTPDTFRPMFEIIRDLGRAWNNLTQVEQAYVAEALAGKRQANVLISTLQNWSMAEKQLAESINATGSALRENEIYMQSWEARAKQFTASLTSFWANVINTDAVKNTISLATSLVDILNKLVSTFGVLTPTIFVSAVAYKILSQSQIPILQKSFEGLNQKVDSAKKGLQSFNLAVRQTGVVTATANLVLGALRGLLSTFGTAIVAAGITFVIQQITKAIMDKKRAVKELEERNNQLVETFVEQKNEINSLIKEYNKLSQINNRSFEEEQRYLDIQNQLSQILPSLTAKIDSKGQAHLKSAEAIKEEVEQIEGLVNKQRELQAAQTERTTKDRINEIANYEKQIEQIQKKINMGGEWFYDGTYSTFIEYSREEILKLEIQILDLQQKIADLNNENEEAFSNFVKNTLATKSSIELADEVLVNLINNLKYSGVNIFTENLEELVLNYAKDIYDKDLKNFNNSLQLKRKINDLVIREIGNDWKDYYDTQIEALEDIANWNLAGKSSASSQAKTLLNELKTTTIEITKEVNNLKSGFQDITDEIRFLNTVLNEIQNREFSSDSKRKLLEQYPQLLAYIDDEIKLRKELQKLIDIYKEKQIKAFLDMEDANGKTRRQMLETDEAYFNNVIKKNEQFLSIVKELGIKSLEDFKTISQAKEAIETETISRLSGLWKKYYGATADPVQDPELFKRISAMAMFGSTDDPRTQLAKDTLAAIYNRNKALKAFDELINKDIGSKLNDINVNKSSSSSSSNYVSDIYGLIISELDKQLKVLEYNKSKLSKTSEEYRSIIQQEIDVLKQKQQATHEEANRLRELLKIVKEGTKEYDEYTKTINDLGKTWLDLQNDIDTKTLEIINSKTEDLNNTIEYTKSVLNLVKTELQYLIPGTLEYTNKLQEQVNTTKEYINALINLQNHYQMVLQSEALSIAQKDQYIAKLKEVKQALFNLQIELKSQLASQADEVISIYKNMYEQQKQIALNNINDQIEAEEKRHKKVIDNLNDEIDKYEELIKAKLKALEREADAESYAKKLAKAQKEVQEIQKRIDILSLDDSYEAKAKREELIKELTEKMEEIEEMQNDRSLQLRKDNLNDLLDNYKKQIDNKKKTEEQIYNLEKERLEKIKKETEHYWNEQINNERKWMQLKQDILNGNLNAVKDSFASFTNILNNNLQILGNSIVANLIDRMQQAKIVIDTINAQINSLPFSSTYDIRDNYNYNTGKNISQKGLVKEGMYFTDAAAIAGVKVIYDKATNTIQIGNLDVKFPPTGIGGTYLNSEDRLVINDVQKVKELLKFAGGDVSKFHSGGIVGGNADSLTEKVNKFFNLKPNETIVKSLLKELQIPQENILNNFKPNMKMLIDSLTPRIAVTTAGTSSIIYKMDIYIDKVENTDKGIESFFKRINNGLNKLGK